MAEVSDRYETLKAKMLLIVCFELERFLARKWQGFY